MWERQDISKGDRLTLINSTLSILLIYFCLNSIFQRWLDWGRRKFKGITFREVEHWRKECILWIHWQCTWRRVTVLGIRYLSSLNKVFLCKCNWWCATKRGWFWNQVIGEKYGKEEGWRSYEARDEYVVGPWKFTIKEWDTIVDLPLWWVMGGRWSFWKDKCCGNEFLCVFFLSLYALVISKEVWVVDLWDQVRGVIRTLVSLDF